MDYWREAIEAAFEEADIEAMGWQIELVAGFVEVSHENYGMYRGYDVRQSPVPDERDRKIESLERQVAELENDVHCYRKSVAERRGVELRDVWLEEGSVMYRDGTLR